MSNKENNDKIDWESGWNIYFACDEDNGILESIKDYYFNFSFLISKYNNVYILKITDVTFV